MLAGSALGAVLAAFPAGAVAATDAAASPRLSFFADRPMIDPSGLLPAYLPPQGHRGSGPLGQADEARLRFLMPFMT